MSNVKKKNNMDETKHNPRLPVLYASFDVESDGNNASQHSMISLGICFLTRDNVIIDEVEYHIYPRLDRYYDKNCVRDFWMHPEQKEAWSFIFTNQITAAQAMHDLANRLSALHGHYHIEWVAAPSCFDWMFLKSYYEEFGPVDKPPLSYKCADIGSEMKSMSVVMNMRLDNFMRHFRPINPKPHFALYDARTQGQMYVNFVQWRGKLRGKFKHIKINSLYSA